MRCLLRKVVLMVCLAAATPAWPQDNPGREQLSRFANGMTSMQADFEQRVIRNDGVIEDQSDGKVWLQQPQLFRWEYGGDFPEIVVADGKQIWIYDEVLEQVTVKPQSEFSADSPLGLITDFERLDEQFEVREAGDLDGMVLLELRSKDAESDFERILLGLADDELRMMTLEDAFGIRTELNFSMLQRNLTLDTDLFRFVPPDGVDVIGALGFETPQP